jgi:ABC-type multidrug transport system fused ATPase/permease subunit
MTFLKTLSKSIFTEQTAQNIFTFWKKLLHYKKPIQLVKVDFSKPWWKPIWDAKSGFILPFSIDAFLELYFVFFPLLIVWTIQNNRIDALIWTIILRIILIPIREILYKSFVLSLQSLIRGVEFYANQFFLSTDPVNHSTRDTGQISSKVDRALGDLETMIYAITWEVFPILIGIIGVFFAISSIDFLAGLIVTLSLILLIIFSVVSNYLGSFIFQKKWIQAQDDTNSVKMENLQQTALIRSVFATQTQLSKLESKQQKFILIEYLYWRFGGTLFGSWITIYYIIGFGFLAYIFAKMNAGNLDAASGISLISTFFLGTFNILNSGQLADRLSRAIISVQDLFKFIRKYGDQTYPVLEENLPEINVKGKYSPFLKGVAATADGVFSQK